MNASRRERSSEAWLSAWIARTNSPGRPRTVSEIASDAPPVSGTKKRTNCFAPSGTCNQSVLSLSLRFHVSTVLIQSSGGGLVAPRRNADRSRNFVPWRSEEHTSELQSLMRNSYAVFCLKKKQTTIHINRPHTETHHK